MCADSHLHNNSTPPPRYEQIDRFVQGLSALFLAVRRRPVIRYQRGSEFTQRLADRLYQLTYKQVRITEGSCKAVIEGRYLAVMFEICLFGFPKGYYVFV